MMTMMARMVAAVPNEEWKELSLLPVVVAVVGVATPAVGPPDESIVEAGPQCYCC
jgi:hypothetical protein